MTFTDWGSRFNLSIFFAVYLEFSYYLQSPPQTQILELEVSVKSREEVLQSLIVETSHIPSQV